MLSVAAAQAQENPDLDLIPESPPPAENAPAPAPADASQRIYLENAVTLEARRSGLVVPFPPPQPFDWQERLFLDARKQWAVATRLDLVYSGRLNFRAENDVAFPTHENVRHDFREGYVSWEPVERAFIDVGRINLKSGVALGNNPTDFFKTRAVVEPLSQDPAVLREDRLGTLMLRGQRIFEGGAVTAAFAPALYRHPVDYTSRNLKSFDPMFDRTNAHDRLLLKGNFDLAADFSPELLAYREGSQTRFGANLTRGIGQKTVAYAEWAGGSRASLAADALAFGRASGALPGNAPAPLPVDPRRHFQNEFAAGASYTTESKVTLNLEYHFDQAGFSSRDWNTWFATGRNGGRAAAAWLIRGYAVDQQAPLGEHSLFLRADAVDAIVPGLELSGFVNMDLRDGSSLVQTSADYYLSNEWTVGAIVDTNLGKRRSDFGSLPTAGSFLVKLARYF